MLSLFICVIGLKEMKTKLFLLPIATWILAISYTHYVSWEITSKEANNWIEFVSPLLLAGTFIYYLYLRSILGVVQSGKKK
jgi:hypothetical protein